jgi:hypothetical protein
MLYDIIDSTAVTDLGTKFKYIQIRSNMMLINDITRPSKTMNMLITATSIEFANYTSVRALTDKP